MQRLAKLTRPDPARDAARLVGGVLIALAGWMIFIRQEESWGDFPLLLAIAIPCALLFALALAPDRERLTGASATPAGTGDRPGVDRASDRLSGWQRTYLVAALLLLPAVLAQLIVLFGNDDPGSTVWTLVLAASAAAAAYLCLRLDSPILGLIAALYAVGAVLFLVDWLDGDAGTSTFRDILLLIGIGLVVAAWTQRDKRPLHGDYLVDVGGTALIAAATLGAIGSLGFGFGLTLGESDIGGDGGAGWEALLVIVSLALIAYSVWRSHRGAAYLGLAGLSAFLAVTVEGDGIGGWPILLALLGAAAVAYSLFGADLAKRGGGGAASGPAGTTPPSGQQPPSSNPG